MGIPVTIDNPGFDAWLSAETEYYECENKRREQSWVSSALLAIAGVAQIIAYHGVYSDVVDKRKELNDKIYQCALREHEHWRDHVHPHTLESFDYVYDLPEIVPDYDNPLAGTETGHILNGATAYINRLDDACDHCSDTCDTRLQAEFALAQTGAATNLIRNEERRAAARRELKLQGMAATDRAGKNLAAPGRQALGVALSINNTLVAMSASGLNSGLATFGRGLAGLATSMDGA